jgi:hypothetical protein
MAEIKIEGYDKALKRLAAAGKLDAAKNAIANAAIYLEGKASIYPKVNRLTRMEVYGESFQSDAQRRLIFAKIASGEIPYERGTTRSSEDLETSWTIKETNRGLGAEIGSDTSYGLYVMGDDDQTEYMDAVGWKTTDEIVSEERSKVTKDVMKVIDKNL